MFVRTFQLGISITCSFIALFYVPFLYVYLGMGGVSKLTTVIKVKWFRKPHNPLGEE